MMLLQARHFIGLFYFSEASSLDDISLLSTPKRSSTAQTASTPAPVPVIESTDAIEARAALKQVGAVWLKSKVSFKLSF